LVILCVRGFAEDTATLRIAPLTYINRDVWCDGLNGVSEPSHRSRPMIKAVYMSKSEISTWAGQIIYQVARRRGTDIGSLKNFACRLSSLTPNLAYYI
jgi:hypothetical protein